jgi:hypothetical protein
MAASSSDRVLQLVVLRQVQRRAFNERLAALDEDWADDQERLFRCECGLIGCAATLKLSGAAFAALRAEPRQFIVRADHVMPEAERVVATRGAHAVVEKPGDVPRATGAHAGGPVRSLT